MTLCSSQVLFAPPRQRLSSAQFRTVSAASASFTLALRQRSCGWRRRRHVSPQASGRRRPLQDLAQQQPGKDGKYPVVDWQARAAQRDVDEIAEAARRTGLAEGKVRENVATLASLLPGFRPSLFSMKAAAWAALLQDGAPLVASILALKRCYPGVDAAAMLTSRPQLLAADPQEMEANAATVRCALGALSDEEFASAIEQVPSLTDPHTLARSLAWLASTYPGADAMAMLASDPTKLLQQGEAVVELTAEYGEESKFFS